MSHQILYQYFIGKIAQQTIFQARLPCDTLIQLTMGCTALESHGNGGELENQLDFYLNNYEHKAVNQKKPDSNLFEMQEVSEEQFMATKPWIGALKPPSEIPPIDASPPTTNLVLSFVNGYKSEDARSVIYYGSNGSTIVYPAAAVGIVMDTKTLKQQFMGSGNTKTANGHTDDITCLAVSPDKKLAATGSLGKQPLLLVWDINSLQIKARVKLSRNTMAVSTVKFSKDGQHVFCTDRSTNSNVYCYRTNDLSLVAQQKCSQVIFDIDVSQDNTVGVATAKGVWFFKLEDGAFKKNRGLFGSTAQGMVSITYSSEHKMFISGSMLDGSFYFWEKQKCSKIRRVHDGSVMALTAFGDHIYSSGGKDSALKISTVDGDVIKTKILPSYAKSIDVHKSNIIIGTKNGVIMEIEGDGEPREIMKGHHEGETWGLAVGDNVIYTSGDDNKILAFNTKTHKVEQEAHINAVPGKKQKLKGASSLSQTSPNQQSRALALNKKGHLAVGVNDGTLQVRMANNLNKQIFRASDSKEWIEAIKYSPQENLLAVGSHDNLIYIYTVEGENYHLKGTLKGHNSFITGIDWSEDGKVMRSVCGAYELLFWNVEQLQQVTNGATEFKDTKWANSTCKLGWDVQGIFPPATDGTHVNSVEKSEDGKLIVTGDDWGFINIYRAPCLKGARASSFRGHSSHIMGVQFDQSNHHLFSVGGQDKTLMTWKVTQ